MGRGGGSHGSPRCLLCGGEAGVLMAVSDAGCGVGWGAGFSHGSPRTWLWGGEAVVLMAVPDAGCGGERRWFSWQSPTLVVGGRGRGPHGSHRRWLSGWRDRGPHGSH